MALPSIEEQGPCVKHLIIGEGNGSDRTGDGHRGGETDWENRRARGGGEGDTGARRKHVRHGMIQMISFRSQDAEKEKQGKRLQEKKQRVQRGGKKNALNSRKYTMGTGKH